MMKKWFQFFKHKAYEFRWALLSGIFVGTTYIPFPPWALLFCYAPLWVFVVEKCQKPRQAFWAGWLTQCVLTLIGFHWIAYTAHEYGELPWFISVSALLLFAFFMHIYIAFAPAIAVWARKRWNLSNFETLLVIALLHSLFERYWPSIFQWHLGYTLLWAQLPAYHWADLIGFAGLSTVILLFNAWLAWIWINRSKRAMAAGHLAAALVLFALLNMMGFAHGQKWDNFDSEIHFGVIQANIGDADKVAAEQGKGTQDTIIRKFLSLSQQAVQQHPDIETLIWPETAYPDYLDEYYLFNRSAHTLIEGLAPLGKTLITGGYSKERFGRNNDSKSTYNALFVVDAQGHNMVPPYRKTELLAFGEYLPLSEQFPILLTWLPFVSNFGRGPGPTVAFWRRPGQEPLRIGGQICYEGLHPEFTRKLGAQGADILVNVTNDSWFGKPFETRQHLYMTLARAIEVRRPLIRSTNTGISTGILANGEVLQQSPEHQEWFGEYTLRYRKAAPLTWYVRFGHWDWALIIAVLVGLLLKGAYYARTRRP